MNPKGKKMCIACGAIIHVHASKCPHCGYLQGHMKGEVKEPIVIFDKKQTLWKKQ